MSQEFVFEGQGMSADGKVFADSKDMWSKEIEGDTAQCWYGKAQDYWAKQGADDDGMLGGITQVAVPDVRGSTDFLKLVRKRHGGGKGRALDCGAGIGRVTKDFLVKHFDEVDLLEPIGSFLETARNNLASTGKTHRYFVSGMESFLPEQGAYDAIWIQWSAAYLTDDDLVAFLQRCRAGLAPSGVIYLKENTCASGFVVDEDDASVTRADDYFKRLFSRAGLKLLHTRLQTGFPKNIFPVRMYAVQ